MSELELLTNQHKSLADDLMEEVARVYPVGSIIRAKISGGERATRIEAKVEGHGTRRYPHELRVRNTRTGKVRCVCAHPTGWHEVTLISSPENKEIADA